MKKLEEDITTHPNFSDIATVDADEFAFLKEENKELKKRLEDAEHEAESWEDSFNELNEESQQRLKNKECWMKTQQEYHKLKDEMKKLKEENDDMNMTAQLREEEYKHNYKIAELRKEKIEEVIKENEKLKEENELWRKQQPAYQEQKTLNEYKKMAEEKLKEEKEFNTILMGALAKTLRINEELRKDKQ